MDIEREELQPGSEEAGISGAEEKAIDKEQQSTTEESTGSEPSQPTDAG